MLRDFKFLRRKNPNAEEAENVPVNPKDSTVSPLVGVDPSRPVLTAIQDPSQVSNCSSEQVMGSIKSNRVDRTPTKPKRRYADIRTPEKQGLASKHRFGWAHKSEHQLSSGVVESKEEGKVVANMDTPRSTRGVGRANSTYSECNSTQNTPSKSVSKPPSSGFCLASGSRPPIGNGANRMVNFAVQSKGVPSSCNFPAVVNTVEVPYFELKEDSSFWMEHNVQVLIRVRPLNNMEKTSFGFGRCLKQDSSHCITWTGQPETRFTFDHVACEAIDQKTLFRMVGLPMVENCLSGYNSCMFAYGQTGSGKTHTMLGDIEELEVNPSLNRGMTPRIFEFLFARIREEEECRRDEQLKYNCKCSFLEIYNEQITDLLDPASTNLMLREDVKKGVYVENLSEFEVHTVTDVLHLLSLGSSNRRVAATNMNRESSRSHSVFTCVIESSWEKDSTTNFRFARLNLVDLAGSERQKSSGAEGERLKEAASINKSLSTLGHVIMVLVDVANGKPKHVPYRDSRLTFLLQDSLGGNSKTIIIANVSPSICSAAETLNTLKFAQRAKLIQNNAIINEDSSGDVCALQLQIRLLKEELSTLKHEKVHRSLSFGSLVPSKVRNKDEDDYIEQQAHLVDMPGQEPSGVLRVSCKQMKSLETTLSGAFRREQMAENSIKQLEAEIEQLNRLVSQREEDTRCAKMMLKFREDKIQRMESHHGGSISADDYLKEENAALLEEIQLLRSRMDKNPEVTRFAHENIKLLEQVRRFQDLYEEGERELLMSEISELRNQLILFIDGNSKHPYIPLEGSIHGGNENDMIHDELKRATAELESNKDKLASCLLDNEKLRRELEELRVSNVIMCATPEHDCLREVIKESIVDVPLSNNQSTPSNGDQEELRNSNAMKQAEEIMNLQLELDILKIILQEERSYRAEADQKSREYEKLLEEIKGSKVVIEALESQELINEIEDLKEILNRKDLEISSLKEQGFRDLYKSEYTEKEDTRLEAKLKKMHESLEKAKKLNQWYQSGFSCQESEKEETEEVRKQVEEETAEVIVCLQEELSVLQQEVHDGKMKEVEIRDKLKLLETEIKVMDNDFRLKCEENAKLAEMLKDREHELRIFSEEWEVLVCEIEGILSGGQEDLEKAHDEIGLITTLIPDKSSCISEQFERMKQYIAEKESSIEKLHQCLQDAVEKRHDVESMLRSLRGAALVITETHQHECSEKDYEIQLLTSQLNEKTSAIAELESIIKCGKDRLRTASSCATSAFVMVNRLSELNSVCEDALSEKNTQIGEFQEIITQKVTTIDETHRRAQSLQMDLEASEENCTKLKRQLSEEQKILKTFQIKLEEIENEEILEATEKLKELNSGVSAVKCCMDEYLHGGDHRSEACPKKSFCPSASPEKNPQTGTGTEQDIVHVEESSNLEDVKTGTYFMSENNLMIKKSRDATIILLKKEIESALGSLQGVQAQMAKLVFEKEEILASGMHGRENTEVLMNQAVHHLQVTIDSFETDLQLKVNALDGKLRKTEEILHEACTSWSQQRELLEAELDDARVVASQKTIEASCFLEKFVEVQDTVSEADIMINELLIANESLKLTAREFRGKENNLISQINTLVNDVESLKLSNNLKDQNYRKLETEYEAELVAMKAKLGELEDIVSEIQTCSMGEWMSLSSAFLSVKSQVNESTKIIRSSIEEVWSEIIVKDCAISVLHLCHTGILLETANGLNAENGLLYHGLCESNAVVSELREHNFRSKRELEMCRVLKGKLLADIKKGYDRVLSKVDEAENLTLQLTFFEKKIKDLQCQEEMMLQRSNDMGSELAVLMKELDCSNRQALASLVDQDRLLKDKDELLENREQYLLTELTAKELESVFLSSELKQLSSTCNGFLEVLENAKRELIMKTLDASSNELVLEELVELNESLKVSLAEAMEGKRILYHKVQYLESQSDKLLEELKWKETALETSSAHISELDQNTQKLQDSFCLLETQLHSVQLIMAKKDEELGEMKCLEKENEMLQDQLIEHKMEHCVLLQVLEGTKGDFEVENHRLRDNILTLESCIAKLEEDMQQSMVQMESFRLCQSVENDLCLRIQDLEMELENVNAVKNENMLLRNKLDAQKISKSEYINALGLINSKNADLEKHIELISSRVFDLIAERFIQIDEMFQKTLKEVEKAHIFMEQFNGLDASLQMELSRKENVLKGLLFDLSMLQESTSNSKDEMEELQSSFRALEKDLEIKSVNLGNSIAENQLLEAQVQDKIVRLSSLEFEIAKQQKIINSLSDENYKLLCSAKDASEAKSSMEKSLMETRIKCENLETEIVEMESALAQITETNDSLKSNLDAITVQMENLDGEVLFLTQELDMARGLAEENKRTAVEAQKNAELAKVLSEEKEEEVKLLERSIEELECTINVLEQKVDFVKGEAERQRLEREELELELHVLKEQMYKVEHNDSDIKRLLDEKEIKLQEALQRLQLLEREIVARDDEISRCKAHISELNFHAEAQASEYKQKFKSLEAMVEQVKSEVPVTIHSANSSPIKLERKSSKPRGSGSPFKCIGLGLGQQIKSERDEELSAGRQRMEELEALASSRQKEILKLKARLATTDSMTHDLFRDVLGVKLNMDIMQFQSFMEEIQHHYAESEVKEKEVADLKLQIDEFIKERNGWLEEIERKQAELLAVQVALEKLRQQDHFLATENAMLKNENANHKTRVMALEAEMKKLSGQQNIQQRIHHHAKIKDENNLLRSQNEDLSFKLRKTEAILSRVKDELAQFRTRNGRNPHINFDEEERLNQKLKETEEERLQLAQKLLGLCTNVLQAAGIRRPTSEIDLSVAEEALHQLKNRVVSLEMELQDVKLKNRISEERSRLSELRPQSSTSVPRAENRQSQSRLSPSSSRSGFER